MRRRCARDAGRAALVALLMGLGMTVAALGQDLDGMALGDACTSCHGIGGHSQGSIPSIGGIDKPTLLAALKGFKADQGSPTIMNRIVRGYSDAELDALATYFSSVKPQ